MKEQEVYVKVQEGEGFSLFVRWVGGGELIPVKELTALVFTPEEFEKLAGEIWEAANDWQADYVDYCTTGTKVVHPDKDTYISSLTNKKQ